MLRTICLLWFLLDISLCVDLTFYVQENKNPTTYVGDIAANTSLPSLNHNQMKFTQLQKSGGPQLFNVTKTGKLYTDQTLDAESLCKYNTECSEIIEVVVQNKKSYVKIVELKVIIEDVNDNYPEFPEKQINLQFYETDRKETRKSIPNAVDRDVSVLNSQITYQLTRNLDEPFRLSVSKRFDGVSKLEIILAEILDREIKDTYTLQVIAKDGGSPPKQSTLNVQISVTDENDNSPVFSQNVYTVSIKNTHMRNKPIITLSASDLDSGNNGKVSYHFRTKISHLAKSYFELNQVTGEMFLSGDFSFSEKHTYKLFIEARDGGNPPMSSAAIVQVNVVNQQNNAPNMELNFFTESTGDTASISEDIDVGSFVAYVKVIDNDIGLNGEVSCELKHDKFMLQSLDKKKYKIVVKNSIDREINSHFDITISCEDKGSPPETAVRKFSIKVMDVNDVQPQFTKETFIFQTYENGESNFPVGFINATDPDLGSGGQLTYSLVDNREHVLLPFKISNFGFITTTQLLDREQQEIYKFRVLVKDNGTPSLSNTANIIVEIMDKNDNAPYFTFPSVDPFSLDVHYRPQSNNDITVLRASDRDSHVNAFIRYEILGGNDKHLFTVDIQSGVLSFSRPVYQNDAGSYDLQLVVKDSGTPVLSATTTLSLTLTVSNKTAVMFTAVDRQSNHGIHINLMIIILVAAVIVSVAIVVSITVCIIRRNNHSDILYSGGIDDNNKFIAERRESKYVSQQMSPQYDGQVIVVTDPGNHRISQATLLRRDPYSDNTWKRSALGIQPQDITKGIYQINSQQATVMPDVVKENMCPVPDHFSEESTLSCHDNSGHGWSEGNTVHYEEVPGQLNEIDQSFLQPTLIERDSNICTEGCHQLNQAENTVSNDICNDLQSISVTSASPKVPSQPWNLPMSNSFTSYSKPLPPLPTVPHS